MENAETRPALEPHLTYDELQVVFGYLNGRDLSSAMRVCSLWSDVAAEEKRKRLSPHLLLVHPSEDVEYTGLADMLIQPVLGVRFTNQEDIGCHCANLPRACDVVTVMNYDLIWNDRQIEDTYPTEPAMSCLFLPAIPGVIIKTFITESIAEFMSLGQQKDVKCLALFYSGEPSAGLKLWEAALVQKKNEHVAFLGSAAKKLTICKESHNRRACGVSVKMGGWSISGEDVSAWSVVIGDQCETEEQVEKTLTSFKAEVDLRKYSVGFMFSSWERGSITFDERNVEFSVFRKLFPGVPLVGSFGVCEFGRTSVSGVEIRNNLLLHRTASVFMILSYG